MMCGIIACRTHAPAIDYLLTALRRLEYRGYDSVGVAVQTTSGDVARLRTVGRVGALLSLESIENCWLTWRNPMIRHHNTFATNPRIGSPTKEGGIRVSLRRRRCKCGECGRKTSKPTHVYEYGDDDRIRIVCPDCMAQYPDRRCADGGPARTRPEAINGRKPQTSSSSTVPPLEGATALVRHHLHTHRRWRSNSL